MDPRESMFAARLATQAHLSDPKVTELVNSGFKPVRDHFWSYETCLAYGCACCCACVYTGFRCSACYSRVATELMATANAPTFEELQTIWIENKKSADQKRKLATPLRPKKRSAEDTEEWVALDKPSLSTRIKRSKTTGTTSGRVEKTPKRTKSAKPKIGKLMPGGGGVLRLPPQMTADEKMSAENGRDEFGGEGGGKGKGIKEKIRDGAERVGEAVVVAMIRAGQGPVVE